MQAPGRRSARHACAAASRAGAVALVAALLFAACSPTTTPSGQPSQRATSLASSSPGPVPTQPVYAPERNGTAVTSRSGGVIVQMFEWKWSDIAIECERWLGPRGFAAVQVSPPQEAALIDTVDNHLPWWQRYQPVSYKIESRSGTRAEFADMAKRCQAAGVRVIADVVLNHMAAGSGTGNAGTTFTHDDFPGTYGPQDFHDTANPAYPNVFCDHGITNTGDPQNLQTCELDGLPDLRTEEPKVQETLARYLLDLYGLGVRGFRIDAAKHIKESELEAILARVRAGLPNGGEFPFIDQEVSDFGGDAVPKADYYAIGPVDDFVYAVDITTAFMHTDSTISTLEHLDRAPNVSPQGVGVVFVSNHDTERGRFPGILLSYKRPDLFTLANVFMLAYPLGTARVMSGYAFTDTEAGPPSDDAGHTNSVYQSPTSAPNCGLQVGQWVCEQRWQAIAGMVRFRNFTSGSPDVTHWWSNLADGQQIAFARGGVNTDSAGGASPSDARIPSTGFVVINRSTSPLKQTLQTGMAPGTYCDVVHGELLDDLSCSGPAVTVAADGTVSVDVAPMSALAIHVGALRR